ncbi:Hypothetical protein CINCED_3A018266 [Cinara cedri]|nr:Hypothetical protein CINCED_3A018266 [Cinara cedri]
MFACSNGQCVESYLVCDGRTDCTDGSDETQDLCNGFITCPSYAFRCKYGACVDESAKCNGIKDCVDGSDENLPECKTNTQVNQTIGTKCQGRNKFKCKSGKCINKASTCDGIRDCQDGSDETLLLCKNVQCSKYAFKCDYGACVNKSSECFGKEQCSNGSVQEHCKPITPIPAVENHKNISQSSIESTTQSNNMQKCMVPNTEGTIYYYNNINQKNVLPYHTQVDQNTLVYEDCEADYYKVVPTRFMVCLESGQWEPLVRDQLCLKKCPPMTSDSLDIQCSYNGEPVDCSKSSINGTKLRPSCKSTHSLPNGQIETPVELYCQSNGKWSGQLYTCVPQCGKIVPPSKPLIFHGVTAYYGTAPWNVGIYRRDKNNNYKMHCGGSLITSNLIISAAHCFWESDSTNKIIMNNGKYKIAVGKYVSNILEMDNEFTQIIEVELIYINNNFFGHTGFYAYDIAVVVLQTKVKISYMVSPVCMDWTDKFSIPNDGSLGKIVGWGKTEHMVQSSTLLEASLPYINHTACRNMYRNGFEVFVTSDKFCAGTKSGQGVLEGDSGAGLTFEHDSLHYLTGVTSDKDPNTNDSIALFTDVSYHLQWIRTIYTNYSN